MLFLVLHGRIVNAHAGVIRLVHGDATLDAGNHEVFDADVGKGPADHDTVITAP